jgi:FKBP-type peptidyl-prolyl cis-trans isomerase 2
LRIHRLLPFALAIALATAACGSNGPEAADEPDGAITTTTTDEGDTVTADGSFIVQDGDLVEAHYVGTLDDGSQFDSSRERGATFSFTVGAGQVIPGFDEAVRGGRVGDVITVRIDAEDAYGEPSDDNIIEVPFNPEQGDVKVGDEVYLTNGQPALVLAVTDETVTLDANHPLAGEALTFEIEIIAVTRG